LQNALAMVCYLRPVARGYPLSAADRNVGDECPSMRVCLKYMEIEMTLDAQAGQTPQEPYNDVHGKQRA
jgi:hypothetical protein